jgi:hypothetical protein
MNLELLTEPELDFGAGKHVDIRFGLKNYGPVTFEVDTAPKEIQVGLSASKLFKASGWMDNAQKRPGKVSRS